MLNFRIDQDQSCDGLSIRKGRKWDAMEDLQLWQGIDQIGEGNWTQISTTIPGRSPIQCYNRWKKILRPDLVRGKWTDEEDEMLRDWVIREGPVKWSRCGVPGRSEKQCRERWVNVLSGAKKRQWTVGEDKKIMEFYLAQGPKWHIFSTQLPGRQPDTIKNRFNSNLRKMIKAKDSSKRNTKVVSECKSLDAPMGRFEIPMSYEEFVRRKSDKTLQAANDAVNDAQMDLSNLKEKVDSKLDFTIDEVKKSLSTNFMDFTEDMPLMKFLDKESRIKLPSVEEASLLILSKSLI